MAHHGAAVVDGGHFLRMYGLICRYSGIYNKVDDIFSTSFIFLVEAII